VWGAVQHFAETSGLDAGASAEWAGFELHRGFSIAWLVCLSFRGALAQLSGGRPLSYRGDLSTDRNKSAASFQWLAVVANSNTFNCLSPDSIFPTKECARSNRRASSRWVNPAFVRALVKADNRALWRKFEDIRMHDPESGAHTVTVISLAPFRGQRYDHVSPVTRSAWNMAKTTAIARRMPKERANALREMRPLPFRIWAIS